MTAAFEDSAVQSLYNNADDLRQRGNFEFAGKRYDAAVSLYSAALEVLEEHLRKRELVSLPSSDDEKLKQLLVIVLCNRSAASMQMQEYESACTDALRAAVASEYGNIKALYRLGRCQLALSHYDQAKETIQKANLLLENDENKHLKKSFEELWNQVLDGALAQKPNSEEEENSIKFVSRPVSIKEFSKEKQLGFGNFSEIVVVKHKQTGERFALKCIEKKQAADLAKRQHPNVYNEIQMERRVLLERLSPHVNIIRMYHAFQDYYTLYYLMELHSAWGDLWSELRDATRANIMLGCHRSQAVVWLYEIVDALEHMHKHGIVHRDLKTENVLLSASGHVVIIDFGTAKDLIETDLNGPEFVGTPDFMSPEAVKGTSGMEEAADAVTKGEWGADHAADLWAVGAMAFIMQTGHTPFWSPGQYLAFLKIKRGNLTRPTGIVDDEAWDFISSLMRMDPNTRLGADAFEVNREGGINRVVQKRPEGYDVIRNHPYFKSVYEDPAVTGRTPIPSLRDLCVRAVSDLAYADSLDLDVCDQHPPGDGSSHDLMRLSLRDRKAVMHVLDRRKLLRDPRVYARFFNDTVSARLDKIRPATRDVVGLTQMNDDQGKPPNQMNDPHAKPIPMDPIEIVQIVNPLFIKEADSEETRRLWIKQLKKCITSINRSRPKLVVAAGRVDGKCRKLLSKISESIPVVCHDGTAFFTFWITGVQCIALQTAGGIEQEKWLREQLEQCRMSKHPLFAYADSDPHKLPERLVKTLARGRVVGLFGLSDKATQLNVHYSANEIVDDASIKSTDSEEDDKDEFTMKMQSLEGNGAHSIFVEAEPEKWHSRFEAVEADQ